jgi:hypothetical protein
LIIEERREPRLRDSGIQCAQAHRQLVAEEQRLCVRHACEEKVLSGSGGSQDIELFERNQ